MDERKDPLANPEAELRMLGALLEAGFEGRSEAPSKGQAEARRVVAEVFAAVTDDAITRPGIRAAVVAARRLAKLEQPIDIGTVAQAMADAGGVDARQTQLLLLRASEAGVGASRSGPHFARRVAALGRRRALRESALRIARGAGEHLDDDQHEAKLRAELIQATAHGGGGIEVLGGAEWFARTWRTVEERAASQGAPGVPCGIGYFDNGGGLERREVLVLAGRPGAGKTALGLRLVLGVAKAGGHALVVSAEMAAEDLGLRVMAGEARVLSERVRDPRRMQDDDWPRLGQVMSAFDREGVMARLRIAAPEDTQLGPLEDAIVREHAICPLDVIMVDYVQLVRAEGRSREEEVAKVSRACKRLAKHTGAAVIALAQLNREVEKRGSPIPQMSDLRDSGQLEQDAATIAFVSQFGEREDGNGIDGPYDDRRVIYVRKRRHGTANVAFPLRFIGDRGPWFEDM